ncbi:MAG TPA: Rho termination factor N-terminal domain-containing protein, partial [Mycobacteriales bacterium]
MSDTTDYLTDSGQAAEPGQSAAPAAETRPRRRAAGLSGMLLPELQGLASSLGITGTGRMRKGELVAAIQARQGGNGAGQGAAGGAPEQLPLGGGAPSITSVPASERPVATGQPDADAASAAPPARTRQRRTASRPAGSPDASAAPVTEDATASSGTAAASSGTTAQDGAAPVGGEGPAAGAEARAEAPVTERPARRERGPRSDRSDRADGDGSDGRPSRGDRTEGRTDRTDRADRTDTRTDRTDTRTDRGDRTDSRIDRGDRTDSRTEGRIERGDRTDRGDRGDRTDTRPDRDGRTDGRSDRGDRTDTRTERIDARTEGGDRPEGDRGPRRDRNDNRNDRPDRGDRGDRGDRNDRGDRSDRGDRNDRFERQDRADQGDDGNDRRRDRTDQRAASGDTRGTRTDTRNDRAGEDDDDFDGRGGSRRRGRFRDRNRRTRTGGSDRFPGGDTAEPVITDDDVLLPVAGILDILENYAFVRTSGYLTGPNDVYVSLAQVRRHGLRRGDAITGAVKQPREGERKDKYNALVRLDTVNGLDPEQARSRPEFMKLTPLYPQDRLRLETEPHLLTPRVIDLVMPIGKGQRALIVSPPKAGKTMIMQAIANAVTTNNPECHLMVVLVDERPEEVTD